MRLSTSLLPPASHDWEAIDVAVVIDVLRATSVMAKALHAGVTRIWTCRHVETARALANQQPSRPLLCGERGCIPIEGFDLGNSPSEYEPEGVGGRQMVLTTTNGTSAIESADDVSQLITASFLNLTAATEWLRRAERVHLICAGTEGVVTAEDALLAGAMVGLCEQMYGATWEDDETLLARSLWFSAFPDGQPDSRQLSHRLRETRGGRNLVHVGFERDLERCAEIDSLTAVPIRVDRTPAAFADLSTGV